jgi:hypothetical protein
MTIKVFAANTASIRKEIAMIPCLPDPKKYNISYIDLLILIVLFIITLVLLPHIV